jgi:FAD synthetase
LEEGKRKLVLASGVFDLIHPGHVAFLRKAKEAGGLNAELLVVVARDSTVRKFKGKNPILPEEQRKALVESLKPVDRAVLGSEDFDIAGILEAYKPDIVAVGYDQDKIEVKVRKVVKEKKLPIKIVKIEKFGPDEFNSSTKIKKLIVKLSSEGEGF